MNMSKKLWPFIGAGLLIMTGFLKGLTFFFSFLGTFGKGASTATFQKLSVQIPPEQLQITAFILTLICVIMIASACIYLLRRDYRSWMGCWSAMILLFLAEIFTHILVFDKYFSMTLLADSLTFIVLSICLLLARPYLKKKE